MNYLEIFKTYNVDFTQNVEVFKHHMCELKKRIASNETLNIQYETWMTNQVSQKNWAIAEKFLNKVFTNQQLAKIEVFLIATYVQMQEGKHEK